MLQNNKEIADFLSRTAPFAGASRGDLESLAASARLNRYAPGAQIFLEGERSPATWIVHSGRVRILSFLAAARTFQIERFGPRQLFGICCRLGGGADRYQCTAVAEGPAAVLRLPEGLSLRSVPDRTLPELLVAGEIDAIISARPPDAFLAGDPRIGRLFPNYREVEEAYFRETGIFPIMHGVVLRRDVFEAKPWVARNLCLAFEEAKRRSLARILDKTVSSIPLPWLPEYAETVGRDLVFGGGDLWPYGVEANRKTLDAFLQYCFEQGVAHRRITTDELFPKEARAAIVV